MHTLSLYSYTQYYKDNNFAIPFLKATLASVLSERIVTRCNVKGLLVTNPHGIWHCRVAQPTLQCHKVLQSIFPFFISLFWFSGLTVQTQQGTVYIEESSTLHSLPSNEWETHKVNCHLWTYWSIYLLKCCYFSQLLMETKNSQKESGPFLAKNNGFKYLFLFAFGCLGYK